MIMDIFEYFMPPFEETRSIGMTGEKDYIALGTIINSTSFAIHLSDEFIASIKVLASLRRIIISES